MHLIGWLYASHVFLPHDRSTLWCPCRIWSFPRQVDADCEAEHRPGARRERLALVARPCLWLPNLHQVCLSFTCYCYPDYTIQIYPLFCLQGNGAIPPDKAILATSFHPSQGTAFLLLLKTIPGFLDRVLVDLWAFRVFFITQFG